MKQFILKTIPGLLLLFAMCMPFRGSAQCMCDVGVPATPVEHIFTLDTTTASATTLVFPRFNPAIGTLSCITLHDTISIISLLGIRNLDPADKTYRFRLTVNTTVIGPVPMNELYRDNFEDRVYGPDLLGAMGSGTDSIVYGPDTVFDNVTSISNIPDVAAYMGAGNVSLTYEIGGGVSSLAGGINFNSSVRTRTWGSFRLTYYWCPTIILAANIKNFSAIKDNNRVNLSWQIENEEADNKYELQMSRNGRQFQPIGKFNANLAPEASASYQYQYLPEQAINGKIYFRLKQTNSAGKTTYSVVRFVEASQEGKAGTVTIYPNPVRGQVSMQFGKTLNGNYKVELISLTGQVVYQRMHRMNNTNSILFDIPGTPAGIYYLRASNTQGNETFTSKLTVQH
jgi:hypothetical protein